MDDQRNRNDLVVLGKEVEQSKKDEADLPILKQTDESMQFHLDIRREPLEFRERLESTMITTAIKSWLSNLKAGTKRNYGYYIQNMISKGIIPGKDAAGNDYTIGHFRHVPHNAVIDHIKKIEGWSEGTRQLYAACYISFTAYLERLSHGWFRKAQPSTLESNKTFFQIRDKCATQALKMIEWHRFIDALQLINHRDALIARCMLQGAKRISEVLELTLGQVDVDKNIIRYHQKKTGGLIREMPISYPARFIQEIMTYIEATKDRRAEAVFVFITRNGKPLTRSRCNHSFKQASSEANIRRVTPHMLRATWVTMAKEQGVQDSEIMKVSGHSSSKMIYAYDKTSAEDNYTKKMVLI